MRQNGKNNGQFWANLIADIVFAVALSLESGILAAEAKWPRTTSDVRESG